MTERKDETHRPDRSQPAHYLWNNLSGNLNNDCFQNPSSPNLIRSHQDFKDVNDMFQEEKKFQKPLSDQNEQGIGFSTHNRDLLAWLDVAYNNINKSYSKSTSIVQPTAHIYGFKSQDYAGKDEEAKMRKPLGSDIQKSIPLSQRIPNHLNYLDLSDNINQSYPKSSQGHSIQDSQKQIRQDDRLAAKNSQEKKDKENSGSLIQQSNLLNSGFSSNLKDACSKSLSASLRGLNPIQYNSSNEKSNIEKEEVKVEEVLQKNKKWQAEDHKEGQKLEEKQIELFKNMVQLIEDSKEKVSTIPQVSEQNAQNEWTILLDFEKQKEILGVNEPSSIKEAAIDLFSFVKSNSVELKRVEYALFKDEEAGIQKEVRSIEEKKQSEPLIVSNSKPFFEDYEVIQVMGKGAHGLVLKVRNKKDKVKAIKLFTKDRERIFLHEISILSKLKNNYVRRFEGLSSLNVIETKGLYGMIMKAGVGTLYDFKCYLRDSGQTLKEFELMNTLASLYDNYKELLYNGIAHRDIKPHNVILHLNNLAIELIDYSLAVYTEEKEEFSQLAGTLGYIDPHIYSSKKSLGKVEIISGDLFSMGIVMLELALPEFKPEQNNTGAVKSAISKLDNFPNLAKILNILLFSEGDKIQELDEYSNYLHGMIDLDDPSDSDRELLYDPDYYDERENQGRLEYDSGLRLHYTKFVEYLLNRLQNKTEASERDEMMISEPENRLDLFGIPNGESVKSYADYHFKFILNHKNRYNSQELMGLMDSCMSEYKHANEKERMLLCFENIVKWTIENHDFLQKNEHQDALKEFLQNDSVSCNPLTFSTFGVYFYKQGDLKIAKKLFIKGLEKSQDELTNLILLNNYACVLFDLEYDKQQYIHIFQKAYGLIKDSISDGSDYITDMWLDYSASCISDGSKMNIIGLKLQKERLFEVVLQLDIERSSQFKSKDVKLLGFIIFFNLCLSRACLLTTTLKKFGSGFLLDKIRSFTVDFIQTRSVPLKLSRNLQVFCHLLKWTEIFLGSNGLPHDIPQLNQLNQDAKSLNSNKKHLYILFQEEKLRSAFEMVKGSELFLLMIGFMFKPVIEKSAETKDCKEIINEQLAYISEVTSTVYLETEYHFSIFEVENIVPEDQRDKVILPRLILGEETKKRIKVVLDHSNNVLHQYWSLDHSSFDPYYDVSGREKPPLVDVPKACFSLLKDISLMIDDATKLDGGKYVPSDDVLKENMKKFSLSKLQLLSGRSDANLISDILCTQRSLKHLELFFVSGYIAKEGIKILTESIKMLEVLEEIHLQFSSCPKITIELIYPLLLVISKSPSIVRSTVKFIECGQILMQEASKLKSVFQKDKLSKPIDIIVEPI